MTMHTRPLIIIGTGGNAHDILDIVDELNQTVDFAGNPRPERVRWRVDGFLDDARPPGTEHLGIPVLGSVSTAASHPGAWFVNAVGSDSSYVRRPEVVATSGLPIERFATLVHPAASVSSRARLGRGTYVAAGVVVAGGVVVGDHVHLGSGCVIGHDAVIEDYAVVAAGAVVSGFARLSAGCYIGANASVRPSVTIGRSALTGMAAVVVRDVPEFTTVVGNPARHLERRARS